MSGRVHKLGNTLRQPVPSWAFLLTVLGLVAAMLFGYSVLNSNTNSIKTLTDGIASRSAKRDAQLCDQAHINQALKPYILPNDVRKYINKFLADINTDKTECKPAQNGGDAHKSKPRPKPSKAADSPSPTATVTRTIVTPEGTRTVKVRVTMHPKPRHTHKRKHPTPKPTSVLCIIPTFPSPIPPVGGCK